MPAVEAGIKAAVDMDSRIASTGEDRRSLTKGAVEKDERKAAAAAPTAAAATATVAAASTATTAAVSRRRLGRGDGVTQNPNRG